MFFAETIFCYKIRSRGRLRMSEKKQNGVILEVKDEIAEVKFSETEAKRELAIADATASIEEQDFSVKAYVTQKEKKRYCYRFLKRVFDFVSAFIVSVILLIPMFIVGLLVVIKDFGSPFYKQKRLGKTKKDGEEYKVIGIYKFRSMKKGADKLEEMLTPEQLEEYKKEYKLRDDPRLIGYKKAGDGENGKCFGAKIRRMSLDELPQILFNICILGNMSVVGPRPLLKDELEQYYTEEEQKRFLSVKPGLTGYWQAYARNNATYESGERQKMELYYIDNRSVWLDIKIILKTVISVLKREGAE